MNSRISLRFRICVLLAFLVMITIIGGMIMVEYTYRIDSLLTFIIDKNFHSYKSAESLETALVNQKGFVSYYFLDGNPDWLRQLGEYRQIFKVKLDEAKSLTATKDQQDALEQIEKEYKFYINSKDTVIKYYKQGDSKLGSELHHDMRNRFFHLLDLCENYKLIQIKKIQQVREESLVHAKNLRFISGVAILIDFILGITLAFILITQILSPVKKLALEANPNGFNVKKSKDEVKALSMTVRGLIQDAGKTHSELKRSRKHLLEAEKMAMVGKLAASMAHSIRNPLTSVKMRLFSLNRSLNLSTYQKEDFQVISDEIRHIDTIVQNFLEFSRPPKLKIQTISPSAVIDLAIQLLKHRLKSYDVTTRIIRQHTLPEIEADPDQLKEVFVNIIINACEAMEKGGSIIIHEEETVIESIGKTIIIRLQDNGPGVPEKAKEKIFNPFFTTKEEGTGLGLSIAARIVEEHKGWLDVDSKEGEGTSFIITIPINRDEDDHNTYN